MKSNGQPTGQPTPEHQRGGTGIPQRLPVPAPRPHLIEASA